MKTGFDVSVLHIISTIVFTILVSLLLKIFISGTYHCYIIPLIAVGMTHFILGDWDNGHKHTISDIFYWSVLLNVGYYVTST